MFYAIHDHLGHCADMKVPAQFSQHVKSGSIFAIDLDNGKAVEKYSGNIK